MLLSFYECQTCEAVIACKVLDCGSQMEGRGKPQTLVIQGCDSMRSTARGQRSLFVFDISDCYRVRVSLTFSALLLTL